MITPFLFLILGHLTSLALSTMAHPNGIVPNFRRQTGHCQPFSTTFASNSISSSENSNHQGTSAPFIAISPENSYQTASDGLHMFLHKPQGPITTKGNVNSVQGDGATINSTFTIQYGRVTFEVQGVAVAGVITAVILIADQNDEIDVELVGGDPKRWQTNVYAPRPTDTQPLWGVFGQIHDVKTPPTVSAFHNYTIDWREDGITWSVDGLVVRTLTPGQTRINGTSHFPTHPSHIQLGIWDASSPAGTSEWAKGPIDWKKAPETMSAVVKSVHVECP